MPCVFSGLLETEGKGGIMQVVPIRAVVKRASTGGSSFFNQETMDMVGCTLPCDDAWYCTETATTFFVTKWVDELDRKSSSIRFTVWALVIKPGCSHIPQHFVVVNVSKYAEYGTVHEARARAIRDATNSVHPLEGLGRVWKCLGQKTNSGAKGLRMVEAQVSCAHGYILMQDSCPGCDAAEEWPHQPDMVAVRPEWAERSYSRCHTCGNAEDHPVHRGVSLLPLGVE